MTTDGRPDSELPTRQGVRLRFVMAFVLIVVGAVPSAILASWLHARAIEIQIADVSERSLLLAKTLARFIRDDLSRFRHSFDALSVRRDLSTLPSEVAQYAVDSRVSAVCVLSGAKRPQYAMVFTGVATCLPRDQSRMWSEIEARAPASGGGVVFSQVLLDSEGFPAVFAVNYRAGLPIAVARMSLDHLRELRRSIVFGERGHAAIVDHLGNIVSHPRPDWEAAVKNIAVVDPVTRMIDGETGVSRFHSPAANLQMVAGFAAIPEFGWGVMVPQPENELAFHAEEVRKSVKVALIIGVLVAGVLAWWLAGRLTAPIAKVEAASRRLADGDSVHPVVELDAFVPAEVASLTGNFNKMAEKMHLRAEENNRILEDIRQLQAELEERVAERTLELTVEIGERDRVEKELLRSKAEVEYANRAKTEFLAHMSHELRTPLNAILGFAEVVRDTDAERISHEQIRQYIQYIHDSGSHLLTLINDLLDISRIEVGAMGLDIQEVDLSETMESCVTIVTERASKAGLRLSADLQEGLGVIEADPTRLRQIVLNLLINSVKFTPKGGSVELRVQRLAPDEVEITVRDSGIGIAHSDMSRIMEPFSQARQSHISNTEGTGLGLPLAKAFAELHGGTLKLESELGVGTIARVILPARQADEQ